MSIATVGTVLGLAVLDTLSPAVLGVTLYVLLTGVRRAGRLIAVYLVTVAASYFALGVALMSGLAVLTATVDGRLLAWGQVVLGAVLFIGSWWIPREKPDRGPRPPEPGVRTMVLLGFGTWFFEFITAVPFFGAIGIMTAAGLTLGQWAPLLAVYVTIMVLPGVALLLAGALARSAARPRFERWQGKLGSGSRTAASWMIGIAGVLVALDALPRLGIPGVTAG